MTRLFPGLWFAVVLSPCVWAVDGESPTRWFREGRAAVVAAKHAQPVTNRAKNIILFIGDGMGVSTVTAARILDGQRRGQPGEENLLAFETLPYSALIKTYNTDQQTSDSAGTISAIVTGIKTRAGVLSVNQNVIRGDHESAKGNEVTTIFELAEQAGLSTGIVTTARVTHATSAACYAHSPERTWETDGALTEQARRAGFADIARQLIDFPFGDGIDVVLGGGRRAFFPQAWVDPEYPTKKGRRLDGRDLTRAWLERPRAEYVWNKAQFDKIDTAATDRLLGLFEWSHMQYEHDRAGDSAGEPSLAEMTAKAIELLKRNPKGFILMVEGGRIDHGHHACNAYRALTDTIAFSDAVRLAKKKTDRCDTLMVVTADHSHVFTIGGYATRGNPILGKVIRNDWHGDKAPQAARDSIGKTYTTLAYANGPGYTGKSSSQPAGAKKYPHESPRGVSAAWYQGIRGGRPDLSDVDTEGPEYLQEAAVPLQWETHGGEDVPLYADGPNAHLFHGVLEQNVIFHVMVDALGLTAPEPSD